jgi:hypothetical protein
MGNETETNRSSALSPEMLAVINASISSAVKEVFAALKPQLEAMALTPEKLRQANEKPIDPKERARVLREERESAKSKADEEETRKLTRQRQDACLHQDANGRSAICLVHNFLDHQPRGICPKCNDLIHPKEWRIAASEEQAHKLTPPNSPASDQPRGMAYIVPAHRDYRTVLSLESHS